jgi:hypothetical protein
MSDREKIVPLTLCELSDLITAVPIHADQNTSIVIVADDRRAAIQELESHKVLSWIKRSRTPVPG